MTRSPRDTGGLWKEGWDQRAYCGGHWGRARWESSFHLLTPVLAPARGPWELRVSGRVPLLVQAPTRLEQKSFSKFSTESTSKDPALESVTLRNNWRWADGRVF